MHEPITLDTEPSDLKKKITNAEKQAIVTEYLQKVEPEQQNIDSFMQESFWEKLGFKKVDKERVLFQKGTEEMKQIQDSLNSVSFEM